MEKSILKQNSPIVPHFFINLTNLQKFTKKAIIYNIHTLYI